jgi:ubiquinone biosynthesis monooxygenase Coq7
MNATDQLIARVDKALRTVSGVASASRPNPAGAAPDGLEPQDRPAAGALMRVNHVGEVCAQALYQAQALTARTPELRQHMDQAALEEGDHLAWTQERLAEMGDRVSLLNPLWYAGAFGIGLLAGRLGDRVSLGFLVETERQVEEHLAGHLKRLPEADVRSRAIVQAMQDDERRHADEALAAGGQVQASTISKLVLMSAVLPSMMLAEQ